MPRIQSIIVSDPEIENSGFRSHAVFKDVNGVENSRESTTTVRRRYREFALLQDCLRANNPGCILPPLPPPTIHIHPSRELLETRIVLLQRYLDNILSHRSLYTDPSFWLFVESQSFTEMIHEFRLLEKSLGCIPRTGAIRDSPRYPDALEDRLEYFSKITNRLEVLKGALSEFFSSKRNLADRMTDMGKALTGYIDAATDKGKNLKLIQLIDSIETISELVSIGAVSKEQTRDAKSFTMIIDDYIRTMQEVEQTFALKRSWRAVVYTLEIQIIDTQAALVKSHHEKNRNFDKNYKLSESFLKMKEELKSAIETHDTICQRLASELDRIDGRRMLEIENCIDCLLKNLLDAQMEIVTIWEGFLSTNESVISLNIGSEVGTMF